MSESERIAALRDRYRRVSLTKAEAGDDPLRLFNVWFAAAVEQKLPEPTAMTLATASSDGKPSARTVLLKGFGPDGFLFYTNYESRKARELSANPRAALMILWLGMQRQVRIEGRVGRLSAQISDQYFSSRPQTSQLSATASPQSQVVETRAVLERRIEALSSQFSGRPIPRPDNWGGYRVLPDSMEFWQGRNGRLHDRLLYRRLADSGWSCDRLAP